MDVVLHVEGVRHGKEYQAEYPVNVHWNLARGRFELLSELQIRETLNDLLVELQRRGSDDADLIDRVYGVITERAAVHTPDVARRDGGLAYAPGGSKRHCPTLEDYDQLDGRVDHSIVEGYDPYELGQQRNGVKSVQWMLPGTTDVKDDFAH